MSSFAKIKSRLAAFAIPQPTLVLVCGQTFVLLASLLGWVNPGRLVLVPSLVLEGEVWRLVSFIFVPPSTGWLFAAFALYLLYLFGTALEHQWGVARFNLFLLTGYLLTVGAAFVTPERVATNSFVNGSIFLAFAHLNPSFVLMLFFVLPVQIRWLAALTWVLAILGLIQGDNPTRLMILAAAGNLLLFFGKSMIEDLRSGRRRMRYHGQVAEARREAEAKPRHTCVVCGKNSRTHPDMDFRYCSKCAGDQCYCPEHIRNHSHITEEALHAGKN